MQKAIVSFVVLILTCLAPQVKAEIIADNLQSTTTYTPGEGRLVLGASDKDGLQDVSTTFVASDTANLSDILLPMIVYRDSNAFNLSLTDSNNTVLESWTGLTAPPLASPEPIMDVASVANPLLTGGDTYTLIASPDDDNTFVDWNFGDSLSSGVVGFRILGTPAAAPEPASLTLLGTALAFGGVHLRRRRRKLSAA
jgi:hypothetical protein